MPRPMTVRTRPSDLSTSIAFFTGPMATSCCWLSGRPEGTARRAVALEKQSQFQRALQIARRSVA